MTLCLTLFMAILIVVTACSGGDSSVETSTAAETTTASVPAVTSTTVFSDVNVATALAMIGALFDPEEEALDALPWANDVVNQEAASYRAFELVLNVETFGSSCEAHPDDLLQAEYGVAGLVTCRVRATDDLSEALGWDSYEDVFRVSMSASGEIVGWRIETTEVEDTDADLELDAFFDWAMEANPELFELGGACRDGSDAECAAGLLELAEEYTETEQP